METTYNLKMSALGYDELVCDIFGNWEDVKDELLLPERKQGSGNGTVHVFLGTGDAALRKEFPSYYVAVENGEDTSIGAINIKHYFIASNIISMLGHACQYLYDNEQDINSTAIKVLDYISQAETENGFLFTSSLLKLSTGSNKLRPYFKQFESNGVFTKLVRQILLPSSSYKISLYRNKAGEYAAFWLLGFNWMSDFEADSNSDRLTHKADKNEPFPLQQIFYGAPGTGKSDGIKRKESLFSEVIRTTFHPDSDYATFVGAYKPVMETNYGVVLSTDELCDELKMLKNIRVSNPYYSFGAKYWYSLQKFSNDDISLLLKETGGTTRDKEEMQKGIVDGKSSSTGSEKRIAYKFVKQAFLKAYISAWKGLNEQNDVLLVIEEINRGNCAQIFGDLFQLLDRETEGENRGYSTYPIVTDEDLREVLAEEFKDIEGIPKKVKNGENLLLPPNLYIWATMNTSDQSLFPIDSAFKRRWEWKYMKIKEGKDKDGNKLDWKIVVKDKNDTIVKIKDEESLSWWTFIQKINAIIASMTSSADKQLGYFFCKADKDGVISGETFVSKVIFYLWNDVFKDYGFEDASLFRYTVKEGEKDVEKDLTFPDFYDEDGEKVDAVRLVDFIQKVMDWQKPEENA